MRAEEKKELKLRDGVDTNLGSDGFIDMIRETNDEVLQVEELRIHTEKLKEDLIHYFTGVMEKYKLELIIPAESFHFEDEGEDNLQAVFLNDSGIISYHFKDESVKSYWLSDYHPSELLTLLSVVIPHLRDALKVKRKEYEETSNILSKIKKYLTLLKEKFHETEKQENPSQDKV